MHRRAWHTGRHPVQRHHQVVLLTDILTLLSPQQRTARQAAQPEQWATFTADDTHSRGCTTRRSGTAAAWGWTPQHSAAVQFTHPLDNCITCPPPSLLLYTRLWQKDCRRTEGAHRVCWHGQQGWFHAGRPLQAVQAAGNWQAVSRERAGVGQVAVAGAAQERDAVSSWFGR